MNQTITEILREALQEIADDHGISITDLRAEWIDTSVVYGPHATVGEVKFDARGIK